MSQLIKSVQAFWADEEGATAIEYGLLASLITVVIIPPLVLIGPKLLGIFNTIAGAL
jgi:pilus assembly protein Flp/PilA